MAATAPRSPASAPTDRSIWPATITSTMPMARIAGHRHLARQQRQVARGEEGAVGGHGEDDPDGDQRAHHRQRAPGDVQAHVRPSPWPPSSPLSGAGRVAAPGRAVCAAQVQHQHAVAHAQQLRQVGRHQHHGQACGRRGPSRAGRSRPWRRRRRRAWARRGAARAGARAATCRAPPSAGCRPRAGARRSPSGRRLMRSACACARASPARARRRRAAACAHEPPQAWPASGSRATDASRTRP